MCRPFFLPCLGAALISAVATLSNIIILKETLPRVVEARAAAHAAKLQDEEQPLLQSNGKESAVEPAADGEGAAFIRATISAACCHCFLGLGPPCDTTTAIHSMCEDVISDGTHALLETRS